MKWILSGCLSFLFAFAPLHKIFAADDSSERKTAESKKDFGPLISISNLDDIKDLKRLAGEWSDDHDHSDDTAKYFTNLDRYGWAFLEMSKADLNSDKTPPLTEAERKYFKDAEDKSLKEILKANEEMVYYLAGQLIRADLTIRENITPTDDSEKDGDLSSDSKYAMREHFFKIEATAEAGLIEWIKSDNRKNEALVNKVLDELRDRAEKKKLDSLLAQIDFIKKNAKP